MALLDLEKAYDTVWITGLLYKLIVLKIPKYLLCILRSYLEGRTYTVHINDACSTPIHPLAGLPQGAVLSTILFTLYRVSQEECARLRESVPYVKVYRYNPKHLYPKLNGYGNNGQRSFKLWQLLHTYCYAVFGTHQQGLNSRSNVVWMVVFVFCRCKNTIAQCCSWLDLSFVH